MTEAFDRRDLVRGALAVLPLLAGAGLSGPACAAPQTGGGGAPRDFDFFLGAWRVHHRHLKHQLVGSQDWEEFEGTMRCVLLLGGMANINESVANRPGGVSHGLGLRGYNAETGAWADWTINPRNPTAIDPPGVGRFAGGVGDFFSDDDLDGVPIKVRGRFSPIGPTQCQWEQAFSKDGATWETNWIMRYTRTGA
jgi:hypothetical protein